MLLKIAILALAALSLSAAPTTTPATPSPFVNPLKRHGADPWLAYVDGEYYLTSTSGVDVKLRHAKHLSKLADAEDEVVWKDSTGGRSRNIWAPEFHRLKNEAGESRWYLFYTASGEAEPSHRMFVAESAGQDIRGPYSFKAQLKTDPEDRYYAIDGTVFEAANGQTYFVWCGRPSETGQGLFISKMSNPWTLAGDRVALKADGFGCRDVREGPAILDHGGKVFLVYSMCGADTPDYRLGMLVADERADPLDPSSWKQHEKVVFSRNDSAGVYGPGHNQFFKSPDGREDWIVYHAKTSAHVTYSDRSARAQKFTWTADGSPDLGQPVAEGQPVAPPSGE